MATTSKKVLRMSFETSMGGTMTISLADPKEGITPVEIEAVMDQLISKDIFSTAAGSLTGKKDIKIVETVTDDLYEA